MKISQTKRVGKVDPKRVCMIAYTNYKFDGRVRLEAESLVKWGYEVIFLVPKQESKPTTFTLAGVTVNELNVRKIRDNNQLRYLFSYVIFSLLSFAACTRLFLFSQIRIIHVHNMPDVLVFAALIPRLFGCKVVLDLHDTVPETYEAKFGKVSRLLHAVLCLEERLCCAVANRVICVNHVQREAVAARGVPIQKIATVITMPRFVALPHDSKSDHNRVFRMVNHGTMSKRLGNDLILHAAAKLVHQIPGFELHIIGGGDNLEELYRLSRSLEIESTVHFHPGVPWDKLTEILRGMDAGIVANRVNVATELMLPSKLIDYTVLGIPAIVPRLRAIEYYFSDEMVSYFEPENVDSIVRATLNLYNHPDQMTIQAIKARRFLEENPWEGRGGLRGVYGELSNEEQVDVQSVKDNSDLKVS
jgi:glycosyltransferase involved in cell wall biosynthesis